MGVAAKTTMVVRLRSEADPRLALGLIHGVYPLVSPQQTTVLNFVLRIATLQGL
jgi:hypothetical protein